MQLVSHTAHVQMWNTQSNNHVLCTPQTPVLSLPFAPQTTQYHHVQACQQTRKWCGPIWQVPCRRLQVTRILAGMFLRHHSRAAEATSLIGRVRGACADHVGGRVRREGRDGVLQHFFAHKARTLGSRCGAHERSHYEKRVDDMWFPLNLANWGQVLWCLDCSCGRSADNSRNREIHTFHKISKADRKTRCKTLIHDFLGNLLECAPEALPSELMCVTSKMLERMFVVYLPDCFSLWRHHVGVTL